MTHENPAPQAHYSDCPSPARERWLLVLALVLSGAAHGLFAPPPNWVLLQTVSWVPALWVFSRLSGVRALLAGWLVGVAANIAIFFWIVHTVSNFTNLPMPVGVLALILFALIWGFYAAIFAWGFGPIRQAAGRWWPLAIAAWFTACEFLNPQLFNYYQGVIWHQVPSLFLLSSLTGVAGLTFLAILCNALILQGIETLSARSPDPSARRGLVMNATVFVALLLFAWGWSHHRLGRIDAAEVRAETVRIALIQPNYDHDQRARLMDQGLGTIANDLVELSLQAAEDHGPIDVFVWPEGGLSWTPLHQHNAIARELVRASGAEVWTGSVLSEEGPGEEIRYYNAAFRIHGAGEVDQRYDKIILLPFGEFMPLANLLPILNLIEGPGNLTPGDELLVYDSPKARFVFLICYEAIRSSFVREGVRQQLDLLVNLTNDSWFGDTTEPAQHLTLAASQAAQYGLPLVRGTSTGISAFVDARGLITAQTGVFTREVLVRDVKKVRVPSPYAALGDWFAWGCVALSFGLLGWGLWRRYVATRSAPPLRF